jgi:hypothetical protein
VNCLNRWRFLFLTSLFYLNEISFNLNSSPFVRLSFSSRIMVAVQAFPLSVLRILLQARPIIKSKASSTLTHIIYLEIVVVFKLRLAAIKFALSGDEGLFLSLEHT